MIFKLVLYLQLTLVEKKINAQQNAAKKNTEEDIFEQKTAIWVAQCVEKQPKRQWIS